MSLLDALPSPILLQGDDKTAYRDPAILYHEGVFHLFYTLMEIEDDGRIYGYTAQSTSTNLLDWSTPRKLTPKEQTLNYSSPGNVIRFHNEWILCLQTYPRPNYTVDQIPRYGDETARLFIMRSHDLVTWSEPELLRVKGPAVPETEMGRMIDPYLLEDKDEPGLWWCFYKQNGVSMSYSHDLENWAYHSHTPSGENVCVLVEDDEYILFHSPKNGVGIKRSSDLTEWRDWGDLITLGQNAWTWAKGRLTAGAVIDLRHVPSIEKYLMFFHGSGPHGEQINFDNNASIGIAWSDDLLNWSWPSFTPQLHPSYTFDPTDWATITPLLDELATMPVSNDGFMDWLNQWNQLDVDIWDAYTQLKHPAYVDTRNIDAEEAYQAYVKELYSTYVGQTARLTKRALTLQPEPPSPSYTELWRRWQNQAALATPDNLPIQAEISQIDSRYRAIMWKADGSSDYWVSQRGELNDLMLRLISLRRRLAQNSGLDTFLEYRWRELNRLDYTIADCQAFHGAVEKRIPALAEFLASGLLPPKSIPYPEVDEPDKLTDGAERILHQVDPEFGSIFQQMREGYLDLGHRPYKVASNESWFFSGVGIPYIHVASGNIGSVFHESGHAIHDYLSFQAHGSMWNLNGPEIFQEFAATSMDMFCSAYLEESKGGLYTEDESMLARQSVLRLYIEFCLARCVLEDAFEHWVYSEAPEDVTAADLDAKWVELKTRFEPWDSADRSEVDYVTGWQRNTWSLFRMPLYLITYAMSMVATCQLVRMAESDREGTIQRFKAALKLGNTRTLPELFDAVGLAFPFSDQDVGDAVNWIVEQAKNMDRHY